MAKFNAKNLAIVVFFGVLLVGIIGIVNAQEALPVGGEGLETAVKIDPGSYEGIGLIEKGVKEYFYINVKPGQELKLEGTFKAFSNAWGEEKITLYNEDRKQLAQEGEGLDKGEQTLFSLSWLPNADKDLYKYYIKRECTWHKIELLSLDISLTDRYDAGSETDAGDSFEKAMNITPGEYKAYLSGESGADTKDFYKLAVKTGQTLAIKITPPMEASMEVVVYDSTRKKLESKSTPNPGAILTTSVPITKSGDVFVGVVCDKWMSENLVEYTMDITTEGEAVADEDEDEDVFAGTGTGAPEDKAAKGLNWWLIIGIIALIVILTLAVIAYFLLRKGKNSNEEQEKVEKIIK